MNARWLAINSSLILLLAATGGCALSDKLQSPVPDVKPLRKERSAKMLKDYEDRRNEAQYQAALTAWKQGNTDICRELVDTLLEGTPKHRGARLLLVQLCMLEEELTEARTEVDKLAQEFPADAEVLHVQGLVCEAAGDLEQAEKCYRRAVEIDPNNGLFATSLTCVADADSEGTPEREPAATTHHESLEQTTTAADSDRLSAALLKAEVHLALGEGDAARRVAEKAAAQLPAQAELESLLARICEAAGDAAEAARHNQRAAQLGGDRRAQPASYHAGSRPPGFPTASGMSVSAGSAKSTPASRPRASVEEMLRLGENALAADTPTAARSYFQRAIAAAPDDESVPVNAAVAALRHDHPELAAELAQAALSRWPKSAALNRALGMAEYRLEHWQAAQAALRQALSLDNSHALSYFLLGCTLHKLGQDEEAERNLSQARQLDTRYALKP